jgi:hypothetical protein
VLLAVVDAFPVTTVVTVVENVLVPKDPELVVNTTVVTVVNAGAGVAVDVSVDCDVPDDVPPPPVPSSSDVVVIGITVNVSCAFATNARFSRRWMSVKVMK